MKQETEPMWRLIARQPFFKGLSQRHFQTLADLAMVKEYKAGDCIALEGDPANRFYLILSGKVELRTETGERNSVLVRMLGAGDDLGWTWLFPPYYFQGSAYAVDSVKTIFFYGTRLRQKCEDDHDLGYELMKRVAQVAISHLNAIRKSIERSVAKNT